MGNGFTSTLDPTHEHGPGGSDHFVQFYDGDAYLLDSVARFIGTALGTGSSGLVIATKPHRQALAERFDARGIDLTALREQGRYLALDAGETLAKFMVDGWPDETRFADVVGDALARAGGHHRHHVRAFGEMVALLAADGKPEAAVRLEELWNGLARKTSFTLFCAYPMKAFRRPTYATAFQKICTEHGRVIPAESYAALTREDDRLRVVSELQQKAGALESEAAGRVQAERTLQWQQRELSDFLENAVEGLHRVGPDGRILWANRALLQLLGYRSEEYVGHHLSEFHADPLAFDDFWRRLGRREDIYDFPAKLRCKDGTAKHVLIHSNVLWEDGRFLYTRCFIRDVSEQRRLEEELRGRVQQLAELDRRKDEFLAMLGHELRNPLSAVRNAVVAARLDDSRRERALEVAKRQTDQLARLVDDLLDVARITHGRISLRKERLYVAGIVERAVETTREIVEQRSHALRISLAAADVEVDGDPARLEQVIVNLITNASKYSEPGGRIDVIVERRGNDAVIRVRDDGMGIPSAVLPGIFDLFTQGERALDRAAGGLGVGLTVVRKLVQLHGGTVQARSDGIGKGAEFEIRLPALPEPEEAASAPATTDALHKHGARVLVLEDNADAAESLMMLLELLGHHVRLFEDGAAALAAARANPPDVMLVDIGLPGLDGYEVARRARSDRRLRHVVLVALTGYGREEDRQQAMAAGFDYHLVKPVDVGALERLVARLDRAETEKPPALH